MKPKPAAVSGFGATTAVARLGPGAGALSNALQSSSSALTSMRSSLPHELWMSDSASRVNSVARSAFIVLLEGLDSCILLLRDSMIRPLPIVDIPGDDKVESRPFKPEGEIVSERPFATPAKGGVADVGLSSAAVELCISPGIS